MNIQPEQKLQPKPEKYILKPEQMDPETVYRLTQQEINYQKNRADDIKAKLKDIQEISRIRKGTISPEHIDDLLQQVDEVMKELTDVEGDNFIMYSKELAATKKAAAEAAAREKETAKKAQIEKLEKTSKAATVASELLDLQMKREKTSTPKRLTPEEARAARMRKFEKIRAKYAS